MKLLRPKCPTCNSWAEWHKPQNGARRIYCRVCSEYFDNAFAPKVLLFDIETSHIKATLFNPGEQRVRGDQITDDYFVLSWAGKWLYGKETFGAIVTPSEAKKRNDKRVVGELHKVLQKADFVITYNGRKFDVKKIQWRFLIHKMKPVKQYQNIDIYQKMKTEFAPSSLAMDYVCKELGYDRKHHTNEDLWRGVEAGDPESIDKMYKYNLNDVWMMEDLYPRVRSWFTTHPNMGAFLEYYQEFDPKLKHANDEYRCPRCIKGIVHESKFKVKYQTPAGILYKVATCPNCSALIRMTRKVDGQLVEVK